MGEETTAWKSIRILHLVGGCRAISASPTVELQPTALNGKTAGFESREYGSVYHQCESLGLHIVGTDFYSHVLEADGVVPPDWRTYNRVGKSIWLNEEEAMRWSEIRHAASKRDNAHLVDLAARIAHQLRVCSWRVRQASESYSDQLNGRLKNGEFKPGERFHDGWMNPPGYSGDHLV